LTFVKVRQLALQYPKSSFNSGPFLIYLTARNEERGKAGVQSIYDDGDLKQAKALSTDGGPTDVQYHQLDVSETNSIRAFCKHLKEKHSDGIDFVINNAGIARQGFGTSNANGGIFGTDTDDEQTPTLRRKPLRLITTGLWKLHKISCH